MAKMSRMLSPSHRSVLRLHSNVYKSEQDEQSGPLCIYESFRMICDVWMAPQTSISCPLWLGARLLCVRNPQRQKIGRTYFPRSFATLHEVPHEADSTELCSLRNFHVMAHFKHLSSTWRVLSAEVDHIQLTVESSYRRHVVEFLKCCFSVLWAAQTDFQSVPLNCYVRHSVKTTLRRKKRDFTDKVQILRKKLRIFWK